MRIRTIAVGVAAVAAFIAAPATTSAADLPSRTSMSIASAVPGVAVGTSNQHQRRGGLSIVKLYIADYALRHGGDRGLCERMIRFSDDRATDAVAGKYPGAINSIARQYGLRNTFSHGYWGEAVTSTADVAEFLRVKETTDPMSPLFAWMRSASPVAADGTHQNWGTSHFPAVQGTKWGWSDYGRREVASASFGPGFVVVAHTYGSPVQQTADVNAALPTLLLP